MTSANQGGDYPFVPHTCRQVTCWREIGIAGDRSCELLSDYVHCRNCPQYSNLGRTLFDREMPGDYRREVSEELAAKSDFLEVAYLALFPTLSAYTCWDIAMRRGNLVLVAAASYLTPVISVWVSNCYLGISVTSVQWLATGMVVLGAATCRHGGRQHDRDRRGCRCVLAQPFAGRAIRHHHRRPGRIRPIRSTSPGRDPLSFLIINRTAG